MNALDPLRFGLIGCGSQGRFLSEALQLAGGAVLSACADVNEAAATLAQKRLGVPRAYNAAEQMLSSERLDAVIVATTHDQLKPAAMTAIQAGVHVFVEKPMALTASDGSTLQRAAQDRNLRLGVNYTMRFMPARILMKQLLNEGAIGQIVHITAGQLIGHVGGWLGERAHGGGPLLYIGTHIIDQVLWVMGRAPDRVFAQVHRPGSDAVEDDVAVVLHFPYGASAQVLCSQRIGGRYGWLDLFGTEGRMHLEWENHTLTIQSSRLHAYRNLTHMEVPCDYGHPRFDALTPVSVASHFYTRAWAAALADFCTAVREGREPSACGADGVRVLQVTDAVAASEASGQPVKLQP